MTDAPLQHRACARAPDDPPLNTAARSMGEIFNPPEDPFHLIRCAMDATLEDALLKNNEPLHRAVLLLFTDLTARRAQAGFPPPWAGRLKQYEGGG